MAKCAGGAGKFMNEGGGGKVKTPATKKSAPKKSAGKKLPAKKGAKK